jgi:myo-inositol-1(or 4)-monophosphatase
LPAPEPIPRAPFRDEFVAIVREAGALAASTFGGTYKSWTKGGGSPVSEADIAVDDFLRERLPRLLPAAWLSEETEDDAARLDATRLWIVDPIDGTRAYMAGLPDWAVSVALVESGRPVAAALFSPMDDGFYLALVGEGTTLNGAPISASESANLDNLRVAGPKRRVDHFAKSVPVVVTEPKVHSLALRIARVASDRLDVAFAGPDSHDWDLAAADLLVHEAGGLLTTYDGQPLIYNRSEARHDALIATGRARHGRLVDIMRDQRQ